MAAFTITTPSPAINLDAKRTAIASFTVANQSGRSLRARAVVFAEPPASSDWFTIDGEAERDLQQGGTESFTVRVAVPAGPEKGPRSFRLDVASLDRPNDEWAHGPVVGFDLGGGPELAPGYVETIVGALAGSVGAIVLVLVSGLLLWAASSVPMSGLSLGFLPALGGSLVAATALGGAIGVFAALLLRSIPR